MATRHDTTAQQSAPQINNWIGYLGLATPWAILATVIALAPLMLGEG